MAEKTNCFLLVLLIVVMDGIVDNVLLEVLSARKFVIVGKIVKKFSCIWTLYCLLKIWGRVWESSGRGGNSFVSHCWKSWWLEELDCVIEWQNRLRMKWIYVLIIVSFDSKRLRDIVDFHVCMIYVVHG